MQGPGFTEEFKNDNGRRAQLGQRPAERGLDVLDLAVIVMSVVLGSSVLGALTALVF